MTIQFKNISLYFFLTIIASWLVIVALGPGLFEDHDHDHHHVSIWQYAFFEKLCHQDPNRSYSVAGLSMAVCSRCLGIYTAFLLGMIALPIIARLLAIGRKKSISFMIGAIGINAVDIAGNFAGLWVNTLESRFILGALFGLSVAILLIGEFFKRIKTSEDTYGTEFTT